MNSAATRRFHKLSLSTLVAVYILVLVGGVVRSTGSGMGCPDWPRCFGKWVPPTSVDQLPENYKSSTPAFREKKNIKFAKYLSLIGLRETSQKLLEDKSITIEADFNASKTWVEYFNRVTGVIIGFMIIALFVASFKLRSTVPKFFRGSLLLLVLVILQGWFGSIVVSTNLTQWTITVHMFLALVMVAVLVWLMVRSGPKPPSLVFFTNDIGPLVGERQGRGLLVKNTNKGALRTWLIIAMILVLIQTFLGTQVREALDRLAGTLAREEWIPNAGTDFIIHRTFSWIIVAIPVVLWLKLRKTTAEKSLTLVPLVLILGVRINGYCNGLFCCPFFPPANSFIAVGGDVRMVISGLSAVE
ncbi:MAG: COX15/CtaA family protein [Bacteroidota bacterium]